MIYRIFDGITVLVAAGLSIIFMGLVATVTIQVVARTILGIPMIWTLDLAQLLFSWLIFVGGAVGLRKNIHYIVNMFPETWVKFQTALDVLGFCVSVVIVYVLVRHGIVMVQLKSHAMINSLGISAAWNFLSIPVSGALMGIYLLEYGMKRVSSEGMKRVSSEEVSA